MFIHHDYHENLDPYDPFRPPCLPSHMFTFHLYSYSHSMYPRSPPKKKTPSSCHSSPPSWCHKKVWRRIFGHHTSNPISFFATLAHLVSSMTTSRLSAPPKFLQEMMRSGSGCQCWAVDWWGIILFFWVDMCLFLHLPHPFAELSQFKRLLLSFVAPSTVSPRKQGNYIKNILAVTEHDGIQFKLNRNNGCRKFSTVNMLWTWHFTNKSIYRSIFFSRMRGKGSRFTLGVWGLRVCSLDVAFASATVRNRPQPSVRTPYGRAYGKFCRGGPFWRFQTSGCFVSRGRRGTAWHSDVFCNVSKVVSRGRRNTFATFSEDVLQFSWQAQHFGRVHRHFSWQTQHFRRVVLRVFCKSHWRGCVKWWQGADSVAGVAFSHMCWKLTEASHETSILMLAIFGF